MRHKTLWAGGALAALLLAGLALFGYSASPAPDAQPPAGGPITLDSTRGTFSLEQLNADRVAVVSFGYTSCPDVCPINQTVTRQALTRLTSEQRTRVVPLFISVDPERDSIARLREYVGYFGESFIGATGSQVQLDDIAERYGVIWRRTETPNSAMGYTIDHSAKLFVVNHHGEILEQVLYSTNPEGLVKALQAALEQQA
ncbi:MAG: SCO family protein [Halomonas sp.]|nr:SCO family protein [Halomonas sp.]MDN6297256.1 SCO family protein [Halomonas sp.]MDN6314757.1 SCO family protein [Halomonas sp.]MDN6335878.1 SCO family protein [Halomonas sp.]